MDHKCRIVKLKLSLCLNPHLEGVQETVEVKIQLYWPLLLESDKRPTTHPKHVPLTSIKKSGWAPELGSSGLIGLIEFNFSAK
jgi:hypothetical protein